jgi:mono/diheme cytochrome c family protein
MRRSTRRIWVCGGFGLFAALACAIALSRGHAQDAAKQPLPIDFTRDVWPILEARCVSCHGQQKEKSGVRLDQRDTAMAGGESGKIIVPGNSSASRLIQRVTHPDKTQRMPLKGEPLADKQIAVLRAWIDGGAVWTGIAAAPDPKKTHWAFQPVVRPALPNVTAGGWARNPIDRFILARLEKEKFAGSPPADRRTLLRRLKFDLLGLPPTPEEMDAWLNGSAPDAYEKLVNRYLASPHYGERWARHWLDVVRFAESDGFETNLARPNAWPYRDYVIAAFNADKPFNRFVMEQLAGDALGADAATGFLVGGTTDRVKSPDIALTLQQRADELHDIVSTTGSALLGLTVGCARCHNHKFDPVSQVDYYAMSAVFAGVQHGERSVAAPIAGAERKATAAKLRQELADAERAIADAEPIAQPGGPASRRPPVSPLLNTERFAPVRAKFVRLVVTATNSAEPCVDELEIYTAGAEPRNIALASHGTRATSSGDYAGSALHKLEHVNDGQYGNGRSWISNQQGKGWVQLELPHAETIDRVVWGRDREGKYADRLALRYRVEVALDSGQWRVVASSEDRAAPGAKLADAQLAKLLARRADLSRRLREVVQPALAYVGTFSAPAPTFRLHRGDPRDTRERIAPAGLAAFGARLQLPETTPEQQRRLALARWIADPKHPVTARVIVNRLWQYHFGQGIVDTPSDFGLNGGRPTHPELLDWLATELIDNGWSLKHIHRLIVTSATYRQSSRANVQGMAADAASRLLWRYPPRRLEAEALRDAILHASGKLDLRVGGPGFDLFEPNANYVKVYTPRKDFGSNEWRRMVYMTRPRMQLDDTFGAFDCPDGGQITPKRNRSITPLQALNLLNAPFIVQQSGFFAERLKKEAGDEPAAQVRRGFRLAFGRDATPAETAAAVRLIRDHGTMVFCRALFNANEFLYVP